MFDGGLQEAVPVVVVVIDLVKNIPTRRLDPDVQFYAGVGKPYAQIANAFHALAQAAHRPLAVVHHDQLRIAIAAIGEASQRLRNEPTPVARGHHAGH